MYFILNKLCPTSSQVK